MLVRLRLSLLSASHSRNRPRRLMAAMSTMLRKGQNAGKESSGQLPKRKEQLASLRNESFDVLIIGGGAVGCGCALEAATRGFKTALIEAEDFASGASCKSSKLIEGGNSYLHAAIQGADLQQIFMLKQVLSERATMLAIAPHLNRVQPMLMPIYSPMRLPLYWLGLKVYDAMAGMSNVRGSHFVSKEETFKEFPMLRRDGLLGSLVYYDVQLDDARMCLALAMTAAKHGATVANYVRLKDLMPQSKDSCRTAVVEDAITRKCFNVNSRVIINATGAGTDAIRQLDDCKACPIAVPTMGTHIALPRYYGSSTCGLLFPAERFAEQALVMLPFENSMLVGSLDVKRQAGTCGHESALPKAEEIDCLLDQTRLVLDDCVQLPADHVLSAWTGIKPAIMCPQKGNKTDKQPSMVQSFLLELSDSQMITLAGGRWSTYRVMAIEAIDAAIETCQLEPHSKASITKNLPLDGAEDFCCMLPLDLVQAFNLPMDVAQHLADAYGCNACEVLADCSENSRQRLHPGFPYIQAEVIYACQREYACHVVDVIARRLRVAFVDAAAAAKMLPTVLIIMSKELCWKGDEQKRQLQAAAKFLSEQMGLGSIVKRKTEDILPNKKAQKSQPGQSNLKSMAQSLTAHAIPEDRAESYIAMRRSSGIATPLTSGDFLIQTHASGTKPLTCPKAPTKVSGACSSQSGSSASAPVSSPASTPVSGSTSKCGSVPISDLATVPVFSSSKSVPLSCATTASTSIITAANEQPQKLSVLSPYVMADSGPAGPAAASELTAVTDLLPEKSTTEAEIASDSKIKAFTCDCAVCRRAVAKIKFGSSEPSKLTASNPSFTNKVDPFHASSTLSSVTDPEGSTETASKATTPKNGAANSELTKTNSSDSVSGISSASTASTSKTASGTDEKDSSSSSKPTTSFKSESTTSDKLTTKTKSKTSPSDLSSTTTTSCCTSCTDTARPIIIAAPSSDKNVKKTPSGSET